MIFLSHNYKDKDIVGPIATRLANKYGKENVFYDSWSIKPGDWIIEQMNNGLEKCKYFFFSISENSLKSGMVSLEWQSALHKSIREKIKFIPIKIDNSNQPIILIDKLYIDMYNKGMEQTYQNIIDIIENNESSIYSENYFNVYCDVVKINESEIEVIVKAKRFVENQPLIDISFKNDINEIEFNVMTPPGQTSYSSMKQGFSGKIQNGDNCKGLKIISQNLTPETPLYFKIKNVKENKIIDFKVWYVNGQNGILIGQIN